MDGPSQKPPIHVSAVICESILRERLPRSDGEETLLLTAYHIADAFTVAPVPITIKLPEGAEVKTDYFPDVKFSVLVLMHGEPRKFKVRLRGKKPDGELEDLSREFACETAGQVERTNSSLAIHITIPGDKPGTYWFWIYVDDEVALKLPMLVRHFSSPKTIPEEMTPQGGQKA